jgi:hypothetical protein
MNALSLCEGRNEIRKGGSRREGETQAGQVAVFDPAENFQHVTSPLAEGIDASGAFVQSHAKGEEIGPGVDFLLDVPALL